MPKCFYCERVLGYSINTISKQRIPLRKSKDHIIPKSKGGCDDSNNLVDACEKCNSYKSNKSLTEFINFLRLPSVECELIKKGYTVEQKRKMITNAAKLRDRINNEKIKAKKAA